MSRAPRLMSISALVCGLLSPVSAGESYVYLPVRLEEMDQMPPCTPLRIVSGGPKKLNTTLEDIHRLWGEFKITTAAYEAAGPLDTFGACLAEVPEYAGRYVDQHIEAFAANRLVVGMPAEFALILLGPPENSHRLRFETKRDTPTGGAPTKFRGRDEIGSATFTRSRLEMKDLETITHYQWGDLAMSKTRDRSIGELKVAAKDAGDFVTITRLRFTDDPQGPAPIVITPAIRERSPTDSPKYDEGVAAYRAGDFTAALETWLPLADRGDARAQYSVGDMYYRGEGVERDLQTAARWIRAAAQDFLPAAQYHLGYLHVRGEGVPQDLVQAYYWMDTAAALGHDEASVARDRLAEKMSTEQLTRATALVEEKGVQLPRRIHGVEPLFPELPRVARLEGRVILQARIREDGTVGDIEILRCNRPNMGFEEAAIAAVEQWRYEPALVAGKPVAVYFTVFTDFRLH